MTTRYSKAEIINVKAAQRGTEKNPHFREDHQLKGTIQKYSIGIFGVIENPEDFESPYAKPIPSRIGISN